MQKVLEKIEAACARSKFLRVLRNGVTPVMPLVIISSVFLIISNLPTIFPFIPPFSEKVAAIITAPYTVLNGMIGIVVSFGVGYAYAKEEKINQLYGGVFACAAYLVASNDVFSGRIILEEYIGSSGMFTAMFAGFLIVKIMGICQRANITIKLPDTVPPAVAGSFESIISGTLGITAVYLINVIIILITDNPLPAIFVSLLAPLFKASNSVWFIAFCEGFVNLCWFFGVHGMNMIGGILMPLLLGNLAENGAAVVAGGTAANIGTFSFFLMAGHFLFVVPVAVLLVCKSEQLKAVGKISVVPAFFNISEPYQFGLPIAGNVALLIPNVLYLIVNTFIYYFVTKAGLLAITTINPAWVIPHPFYDYLATAGDWRAFIIWAIVFVVDLVIWAPFLKAYDNQLLKEEAEAGQNS